MLSRNANDFCTGEHVGTHLDAPAHMILGANQQFIHEIPLENLFGPAVRIDVRQNVQNHPNNDYPISVEDLQQHEAEHGAIPEGALVFACTGWGDKYGVSVQEYWGTNSTALGSAWSFPGFGGDAAEWLVANRQIRGVGADTPSCDIGADHDFPVHRAVLANNVWCMEHVARSCDLPATGSMVYAFPMKVKGSSGMPLRVVATWGRDSDEDECVGAATRLTFAPTTMLLVVLTFLIAFV